jgi:hypothetical protein
MKPIKPRQKTFRKPWRRFQPPSDQVPDCGGDGELSEGFIELMKRELAVSFDWD